jgi:hypothetical protein
LVRISHPEVDDILTFFPGLLLQLVDNVENIRRKPLDPLKFHDELLDSAFSCQLSAAGPEESAKH